MIVIVAEEYILPILGIWLARWFGSSCMIHNASTQRYSIPSSLVICMASSMVAGSSISGGISRSFGFPRKFKEFDLRDLKGCLEPPPNVAQGHKLTIFRCCDDFAAVNIQNSDISPDCGRKV